MTSSALMVRDNFVILLMQGEESRQQNCINKREAKEKREHERKIKIDLQKKKVH